MVFIMINTLIQSLNFYSYHNYNGSNCSNSQQYLYKFNVKLTFESNQLITNHMNLLMPKCRFLTSFLDEKSFKTSLRSMLSKMALWTRGNALWFSSFWDTSSGISRLKICKRSLNKFVQITIIIETGVSELHWLVDSRHLKHSIRLT